jgi:hypothetical protein
MTEERKKEERKGVSKSSLRGLRQRERMEKIREARPAGVRVTPANDEMRRLLKHPKSGGFRKEGSVEWPDDRFTKRRLADGSITRESDGGQENPPPENEPRSEPDNAA